MWHGKFRAGRRPSVTVYAAQAQKCIYLCVHSSHKIFVAFSCEKWEEYVVISCSWLVYTYIFFLLQAPGLVAGQVRIAVGHFPIPGRNFVDAVYHIGETYTLNYLQISNEIVILCKKHYIYNVL